MRIHRFALAPCRESQTNERTFEKRREIRQMKIIGGKVLQKGKIVLDNLQCKIQFHTAIGGIKSWAGRFDLPPNQTISPGDYRLDLENGRSGMISIIRVLPQEVHFVGVGPLD